MKRRENFKVAGGLEENGVVVGNTFDKYGSNNPFVRWMLKGYEAALNEFVTKVNPSFIHEVGCGEGYLTLKWLEKGIAARGSDFSSTVINLAWSNAKRRNITIDHFVLRDIYHFDHDADKADLVVCCQVLEHLENPDKALLSLKLIAEPYLIVSVPREPLWSILNMARGKYWRQGGNTPGHIQQWSRMGFIRFISGHFDILDVSEPFPWTMLLCKNRL